MLLWDDLDALQSPAPTSKFDFLPVGYLLLQALRVHGTPNRSRFGICVRAGRHEDALVALYHIASKVAALGHSGGGGEGGGGGGGEVVVGVSPDGLDDGDVDVAARLAPMDDVSLEAFCSSTGPFLSPVAWVRR